MSVHKKSIREKSKLHPRSKHQGRYDLKQLISCLPDLSEFVQLNVHQTETIDFANPEAVKALNKALLIHHYGIRHWELPDGYLVPPIPGRADYIHHIADLLCSNNYGKIPTGDKIKCLDIGVGASCIYPILGVQEYGWSFVGADIDSAAIDSSQKIIDQNDGLKGKIELCLQQNPKDIIYGVLRKEDRVDIAICNPPFHASQEAAKSGSIRKVKNLTQEKNTNPTLNFGGQSHELWCEGGEKKFIRDLIRESKKFSQSCFWFSSLVSKQSNLKNTYQALKEAEAISIQTIPMGQGNKSSRIVAWTFLTKEEQKVWKNSRWADKKKPSDGK